MIGEIVEKYDIQLHENGEYMTPEEKRRLILQIQDDMIIKLNISINLTKKKMDTWEIFPKSQKQQELKFEEEGESDEAAEQLKQAVLYEISGINQGEGEDLPADPEGEEEERVQVPEGQILELILDQAENPDYEKRKRRYKKREAAELLQ